MPKGEKLIIWTEANETKLLHAILAVHDIKLDYPKIAALFGPHIPATAISAHISRLRKKVAALSNGNPPVPTIANTLVKVMGRPAASGGAGKKERAKGRKRGGLVGEVLSDDESMADTGDESEQDPSLPETNDNAVLTTPNSNLLKTMDGRVTKSRASPRKTIKKDYKKIEDPFADLQDATDGEGEKVFGTDKSETENSQASDEDFGRVHVEPLVKTEEV